MAICLKNGSTQLGLAVIFLLSVTSLHGTTLSCLNGKDTSGCRTNNCGLQVIRHEDYPTELVCHSSECYKFLSRPQLEESTRQCLSAMSVVNISGCSGCFSANSNPLHSIHLEGNLDYKILDLTNNRITDGVLENGLLQAPGPQVTSLYLSHNSISTLNMQLMESSRDMTELWLNSNQINSLVSVESNLTSLLYLSLRDNEFEFFGSETMSQLSRMFPNLEYLDLSNLGTADLAYDLYPYMVQMKNLRKVWWIDSEIQCTCQLIGALYRELGNSFKLVYGDLIKEGSTTISDVRDIERIYGQTSRFNSYYGNEEPVRCNPQSSDLDFRDSNLGDLKGLMKKCPQIVMYKYSASPASALCSKITLMLLPILLPLIALS